MSGKPSSFDRFVAYILDYDGDMYGQDERERTRWYEGIALAASVQWIVFPWFLAVLVWTVSADVARVLATAGLVFLFPLVLATIYVEHRRVSTAVRRWSAKRIVWSIVSIAPVLVFIAGYIRVARIDTPTAWGILAGAAVGVAAVVVGSVMQRRRERRVGDDDE